jgi:hypothetical protein
MRQASSQVTGALEPKKRRYQVHRRRAKPVSNPAASNHGEASASVTSRAVRVTMTCSALGVHHQLQTAAGGRQLPVVQQRVWMEAHTRPSLALVLVLTAISLA